MAKQYDSLRKSNTHMNGFSQFDISNGHKKQGAVPYQSEPNTNSLSPGKEGSSKKKSSITKQPKQPKEDSSSDMNDGMEIGDQT
jgi:hypothetical protein